MRPLSAIASKILSLKQSLRPWDSEGLTSSAGCKDRKSIRISRSERARTSTAAAEADDIVRVAQLTLVPVAGFSLPVSALNTLSTWDKEKSKLLYPSASYRICERAAMALQNRLGKKGGGVEEAVAALHSIQEQS